MKKQLPLKINSRRYKKQKSWQPQLLVAHKYGVPRNTISTWLLPGSKERIIAAVLSGKTNLKRKNVKVGKYEDLDKSIFN